MFQRLAVIYGTRGDGGGDAVSTAQAAAFERSVKLKLARAEILDEGSGIDDR